MDSGCLIMLILKALSYQPLGDLEEWYKPSVGNAPIEMYTLKKMSDIYEKF